PWSRGLMMLWAGVYVSLCLFLPCVVHGEKVLVFPMEGSHWVNMKILIEQLHSRGHEITVVRSNDSWYIKENSLLYTSITVNFPSGFDENLISDYVSKLLEIQRQGKSAWMRFNFEIENTQTGLEIHRKCSQMVQGLMEDEIKMKFIRDSKFDLILTDPVIPTGVIMAHYLGLPLVYNVRWATLGEAHLSFAPSPLSYIPLTGTMFSDKMSFFERVVNVLVYAVGYMQISYCVSPYQGLIEKYVGPDEDYFSIFLKADIWLMRVDFVFEFPRPTMPNVVYMGGFQCKPAKPLPQHLEDFVQSSGEHGVIIMSLGTLIGSLPHDLSEEIAAAFAKLPQKVIWRYTGDKPSTLGNNTLLVEWMPQNDLLGHPKTKVFVAHGGTNGIQEAIYHGVPILGIPLVFDQPDNLFRIDERQAGKTVDIFTMNRDTFYESLQEVLYEPTYRNNMQRLSRLHRDTPVNPLDNAIFWIEFVMRHKGAAHLRTESYKMPWYSYHSVDVILFLGVVCFLTFICILTTYYQHKCLKLQTKKEK
uniref:UDP-glucuronosyltransferase n=1 Tax=Periophthalmus magnuspinnatus TaxID=409849 RepID=A0A3B4BFF5_9GOBI